MGTLPSGVAMCVAKRVICSMRGTSALGTSTPAAAHSAICAI
jgi:hypothetical protein